MRERKQIGAIAYHADAPSGLRVLLITSRETGRWVTPKGWPMRGLRPHRAAAREAFEEAGIEGSVGKKSIGSYRYAKTLRNGEVVPCRVKVFPLEVEALADEWPEKGQRRREWFTPADAAAAVEEPELAAILRDFETLASGQRVAKHKNPSDPVKQDELLEG